MNEEERDHKWQASLDTDILEYLRQEGIPTDEIGKGENRISYNLGSLLKEIYMAGPSRLKTIGDLLEMTKPEFLSNIDTWIGRHYRKDDREEYWSLLNSLLQKQGLKMNEYKWQANLDTEIQVFLRKEGIPTNKYGNMGKDRILYNLGHLLDCAYPSIKTISDLLKLTRAEFYQIIDYHTFRYYRKEDREEYWKTMNRLLKKHKFKMYVK